MKVFGWQADHAGCGAFRIRFPFDHLARTTDLELAYDTVMPEKWLEEADVVVGQRVCVEGSSQSWERWAREGSKRLVMELDDDLFHVDPSNTVPYRFFGNTELRDRLRRNIMLSHTVTVSTEHLAQSLYDETGHEDIRVVPNGVPVWLTEHEPEMKYLAGWGGSPTHLKDFQQVQRHLKRFMDERPSERFHFIGMDYSRDIKLSRSQTRFTSWVKSPEDFMRKIDYRIGVAPLAPSRFNRSKSALKFLELGALGIPCVASDLDPYSEIVNGETGFKVRYDHEWLKHLRALANDPELRKGIGDAARDHVKRNGTVATTAQIWESVIRDGV